MEILLNGAPRETKATNVAGLVAELGFSRGTVLVEHNGVALRPDEWDHAKLSAGERVEVLRIVAGG